MNACYRLQAGVMGGILLFTATFVQAVPVDKLLINELYYNTEKKSQEWIELYNPGSAEIDLAGWTIRDSRKKVELSSATCFIAAHAYLVLSNAALADSLASRTLICTLPEWNNSGDEVVLYDAHGLTSDSLVYQSDWGGGRFVSLERLLPQGGSCDPANWASCIDPAGHTAGRANSVYTPVPPRSISLLVSPSPFSPDRDGLDDQAEISYSLTMTHATIQVKIFDVAGRLVRYLVNTDASGPRGMVCWNGDNDQGRRCAIGVYIIFLQAVDETAGRVEQAKAVCVLAGSL